jgi:hypothetical protein
MRSAPSTAVNSTEPIDNLFIDGNGVLVVAEMKRGRPPREVIAQTIDGDERCDTRFGAEIKGEYEKALRLRSAEYHLSLVRFGASSIEAIRNHAAQSIPLRAMGPISEAIRLHEEALQALHRIDVRPYIELTNEMLALTVLYQEQGDLTRAIATGREALALASMLPNGAAANRPEYLASDASTADGTPEGLRAYCALRSPGMKRLTATFSGERPV